MTNVLDEVGRIQQENITAAEAADIKVGEKLARHREKPWAKRLDAIGKLGDQEPLYAMGFATLAIGLVLRDPKLRLAGVSTVAHVAAADLAKQAVKGMVKRTRPHKLLEEGQYEAEVGESVDEKPYQSFPSGHVACTFAAAQALGRVYPSAKGSAIGATGVIALARMVKGAHWPMDILGGLAIGGLASAFVGALLKLHDGERRSE